MVIELLDQMTAIVTDPLRMRAIPECLRGVFTMSCYTNPRLPLPYLYQAA